MYSSLFLGLQFFNISFHLLEKRMESETLDFGKRTIFVTRKKVLYANDWKTRVDLYLGLENSDFDRYARGITWENKRKRETKNGRERKR